VVARSTKRRQACMNSALVLLQSSLKWGCTELACSGSHGTAQPKYHPCPPTQHPSAQCVWPWFCFCPVACSRS
jgi:hypothetical protein